MTTHIGAYARISLDSEGEALGVARQHSDIKKLADLRGWQIVDTYTDNNISAYQKSVVRPDFERMITDLKEGRIGGVVAYDLDRLWRKPSDLERIIGLFEDNAHLVFATAQGDIDLSTSDGRTMARIMVALANKSSSDTSRRVKRKIQEQAENGQPHWGRLPFGYNRDGSLNPNEAPIVRKMGMWFLNGLSYREITWRLNEAKQFTRAGKPWSVGTVRQFIKAERFAAIRMHQGVEYEGNWEPIFDRDEWAAIQHLVKLRKDKYKGRPQSKKYMLTGMLKCTCGGYLRGMTKRDRPGSPLRRTYQCPTSSETERRMRTCAAMCIGAEPLEHFMGQIIAYRLDTPELASMLGSGGVDKARMRELTTELASIKSRRDALLDHYTDGTLTKADLKYTQARLSAQQAVIDDELVKLRRAQFDIALGAGETVREAWKSRPDGWRRGLIELLINDITISKSSRKPYYVFDDRRTRFDMDRVNINWKN